MRFKKLSNKSFKELKEICQPQNTKDPLFMKLGRKISIYFSILFLYLGVSARMIVALRFIVCFIGMSLIAIGDYSMIVIGLLIFELGVFLDLTDGEVFRYNTWKNKGRKRDILRGNFIDKVVDYFYRPLLLIAAGIGAWNNSGNGIFLILAMAGTFFITSDTIIKLRVFDALIYKQEFRYLKREKRKIMDGHGKLDFIYEMFRINNLFSLYFWFGIFGYLHTFLIIYTPMLFILFIKTFFGQLNRIDKMDKEIVKRIYG